MRRMRIKRIKRMIRVMRYARHYECSPQSAHCFAKLALTSDIPYQRIGHQLLTVREASELLSVSTRTIHTWIEKDAIPYVILPPGGDKATYRIPLQGLLNSLAGTYDLAADVEKLIADESS